MKFVLLAFGVLCFSATVVAQKHPLTARDSLTIVLRHDLDSVKAASLSQTARVQELADSVGRLSEKVGDPFAKATLLVTIFSLLMGVIAIIMGFITWLAHKQEADARRTLAEAQKRLDLLNKGLQRIVDQSGKYAEYFLVFFNNSLPAAQRLDHELMKYVLDLASFDDGVRFNAIGVLKAKRDKSALPYLEWVIKNRPESKDAAEDAIKTILVQPPEQSSPLSP